MTNILFTIIVALGMKVVDLSLSPKYYLITYQDGQREEVLITKNDNVCPHYCGIDHPHKVNICEEDCKDTNTDFIIRKEKNNNNNTFNLYYKGKEILLFQEMNKKHTPRKKNSIKIF